MTYLHLTNTDFSAMIAEFFFVVMCAVAGIAALIFVVAGLREWCLIIKEGTRDEEKQPTPDYTDDLHHPDALGADVVRYRSRHRAADTRVK